MLAAQFEANRSQLQAMAHRMLGLVSDADDAVEEAWLRLRRSDISDVDNLGGWLTTVVAEVCLDMLRTRRKDSLAVRPAHALGGDERAIDPGAQALLADSVGPALLVVLETLTPAERLAFVLHDMFGIRFEAIAEIVGCSPAVAQQYVSRARRAVRGAVA